MNALYQMMLKEAQGTLHVNVAPRMLPRVQRNPASPPAAQPTQRAATPQAAQVAQAPQRAATPPAAQASRPPAAPPVIPKGTHQKNPQAPQPPPAPAKARADRYTMGPAKSDAYTLGPAPAQAAPAQATPAAEAPARHPLSYVDGAMTSVQQARANAHTHFTPENLQTIRDTRATVGKWGRRAGTVGAIGAGLAVGKRVLDDGTGAEQDARMRDYLASTQHQMNGALPGMQVYGSYEAFGAEKLAEIDAMEKRAEPSYPYPYAQSAHAAMSAEFGKALAQKLVSEPIDLAHRFLKKRLIDDPKADAVFRTVIEEDPMLRDAYAQNPVALERSFAAVRKMSPSVATLHGPVQSFLRHATVTGGTLDLAAIRQLAETQRFHQSAKQGN